MSKKKGRPKTKGDGKPTGMSYHIMIDSKWSYFIETESLMNAMLNVVFPHFKKIRCGTPPTEEKPNDNANETPSGD
jgi:hypothetical protein